VDRDLKVQDRIVGELLQPGGYDQLRSLGLERVMFSSFSHFPECVDGIDALPVSGYSIHLDHSAITVKYPKQDYGEALGRSFHNGRFVQKLREVAAKEPGYDFLFFYPTPAALLSAKRPFCL
jgi:squalene monooxygenase